MNLPNRLTVGRLFLTVAFMVVFYSPFHGHETVALALFVVASITDHFDGRIARSRGLITNFGILMDPLVDKILTCSAFIAFVGQGLMEAWMVALIVARELAITGLRLLAASRSVVLAAEGYGKHKTVSQISAIIAILVVLSYEQWGEWARTLFGMPIWGRPWSALFAEVSKWAAVFFTGLSGSLYLMRNRDLFMRDV